MNKKMLISAAAAVALTIGVAGCGGQSDSGSDGSSASEKQGKKDEKQQGNGGSQAAPKPDLKSVPKVVAVVNGEEIPKDEFALLYKNQFQQQAATAGGNVDQNQLKKQTANQLVETELLAQGATEQGFKASSKDVDKELKKIAGQNSMKPQQFLDNLKKQGMDEQLVRDQLRDQLQITDYLEDEAGNVQPTEKEMRAYYDKIAAQQKQAGAGGKLPKFSQVKPQLKKQMIAEEQSKVADQLVKGLKKDAKIDIKV